MKWDQILTLQDQARESGYEPADPFEWLPFIEANAMSANFNMAQNLSKTALKDDVRIRVAICKVWKRVQAQGSERSADQLQISQALVTFQCP